MIGMKNFSLSDALKKSKNLRCVRGEYIMIFIDVRRGRSWLVRSLKKFTQSFYLDLRCLGGQCLHSHRADDDATR